MACLNREHRRAYLRTYQRQWLAERRAEWFREHGPCALCGSSDDLQLDHIDPQQKVSHNVWSWSEQRRTAELAKCQVLCALCHYAKTGAENSRPLPPHGTRNRYNRGRCRCDACRDANRVRGNRWRHGLPAGESPRALNVRERRLERLRVYWNSRGTSSRERAK